MDKIFSRGTKIYSIAKKNLKISVSGPVTHFRNSLELCYGLKECSKRSENLINRKNAQFYIEIVIQLFSQLPKKIFFRNKKIFSIFFSGTKISIFFSKIEIFKI